MTRIRTALFQEVLHGQEAAPHGGRVRSLVSLLALDERPSSWGRLLRDVGHSYCRFPCDVPACLPWRAGSTLSSLTVSHFRRILLCICCSLIGFSLGKRQHSFGPGLCRLSA